MNKRVLSVLLALIMVFALSISAFAAPAASTKTITTFNGTVSISNVIKTGDIATDTSFDRAKTDKALEVADKDHTVDNTGYELYYCAGAPVTITFNKPANDNLGINGYNCYYVGKRWNTRRDANKPPIWYTMKK